LQAIVLHLAFVHGEIGDVGPAKPLDLARLGDVLDTSINTAKRYWATARAWLLRKLQ
jgi:hypothetical protein